MEDAYVLQLSDPKFRDLYLCFCGFATCRPGHFFGPAARPNYIIHYILSGKGIYEAGSHQYELKAGQGFLIEPETLTYYEADQDDPWSYIWIGFAGERAKEYLWDLGLNRDQLTFQSGEIEKLQKIVLQMLQKNKPSVSNQYKLQSLLLSFFAVLAQNTMVTESADTKTAFYIERAVTYIRNNYAMGIHVADVAAYLNVDRSYLYKLFEKNLHMAPQEFLSRFRISRAKELLGISRMSVESVALSCGYQDALVFSKAFKKAVQQSPSAYRRNHQAQLENTLMENEQKLGNMLQHAEEETF